jgi:hypothetical protein
VPLTAVCVAGAVAVVLIATTHPWWTVGTPLPVFTLETLGVTFTGSGASAVQAINICERHCPVSVSVGQHETLAFTVSPYTSIPNCSPPVHYTVTKVVETSTGSAFNLLNVSANTGSSLPVDIPSPLGGPRCVATAEIWVTFNVLDQGPATATPALEVTVTKS